MLDQDNWDEGSQEVHYDEGSDISSNPEPVVSESDYNLSNDGPVAFYDEEPAGLVQVFNNTDSEVSVVEDYTPELTIDEARTLTDQIRSTTDVLYILIQRAHVGKAWKALGYTSFSNYVREEFNISRSRAYQLLNQSSVIEQIAAVTPEGTALRINESTAREIKSMMDDLVPAIREATDGMDADEASEQVERMLQEARIFNAEDANMFSDEPVEVGGNGDSYDEERAADQADRDGFSSSGYGGGGGNGDSSNGPLSSDDLFTKMFGDNDDPFEEDESAFDDLSMSSDPQQMRLMLETVYDFFEGMNKFQKLPKPQQVLDWIPKERMIQVKTSLPIVFGWMDEMKEVWEQFNNDEGNEVESDNTPDENSFPVGDQDSTNSDEQVEDIFKDF